MEGRGGRLSVWRQGKWPYRRGAKGRKGEQKDSGSKERRIEEGEGKAGVPRDGLLPSKYVSSREREGDGTQKKKGRRGRCMISRRVWVDLKRKKKEAVEIHVPHDILDYGS